MCYAIPAVVQLGLWYFVGMPQSTFHLVALLTYVGHFVKRVLEALFLHKYSKKIGFVPVIQVIELCTVVSVSVYLVLNLA